jgi:hypothetical protein
VNLDRLHRAPNIAIVGSSSPVGKELKELIQESSMPVGNVKASGYRKRMRAVAGVRRPD